MVNTIKALIALMLMVGGTSGLGNAVQASLPGSPLYAVKLQFEAWQLERAVDGVAQAELALKMAQHRVMEAVQLAQQGREIPVEVPVRFQAQVQMALQASGTLTEPLRLRICEGISATLGMQIRLMQQLRLGEGEPVRAMIQTMEQTRAQIGSPGFGPGPNGEIDPYRPPSGQNEDAPGPAQIGNRYGPEGEAGDGIPNGAGVGAGNRNGEGNNGGNGGGNGNGGGK